MSFIRLARLRVFYKISNMICNAHPERAPNTMRTAVKITKIILNAFCMAFNEEKFREIWYVPV